LISFHPKKYSKACFDEACFNVEIADSPESRGNGLMYRQQLPEGQGMLFVYNSEDKRTFWMKNTLVL